MILVISFGLNKSHVRLSKNYVALFKQKHLSEMRFFLALDDKSVENAPQPPGACTIVRWEWNLTQCYKYEYIFQQVHINI